MKRITFNGSYASALAIQEFIGWAGHDIYSFGDDVVSMTIPANMGKQISLIPGDVVLKDEAGNIYVERNEVRKYVTRPKNIIAIRRTGSNAKSVLGFCISARMDGDNISIDGKPVQIGDFVIQHQDSSYEVMPAKKFYETYMPADKF